MPVRLNKQTISQKIAQGIRSQRNTTLLDFFSAHPNLATYSFINQLLIVAQMPLAIRVANYNVWRMVGRTVNRGATAIAIIRPNVRTSCPHQEDYDTSALAGHLRSCVQAVSRLAGFRTGYLFDESQTSGERLVRRGGQPLSSCSPVEKVKQTIVSYAAHIGYQVIFDNRTSPPFVAQSDSLGGRITIYTAYSDSTPHIELLTLIRELAAAAEFITPTPAEEGRRILEAQAEAVAYLVGTQLGLAVTTSMRLDSLRIPLSSLGPDSIDAIDRASQHLIQFLRARKICLRMHPVIDQFANIPVPNR